jgi:hypothetical protein
MKRLATNEPFKTTLRALVAPLSSTSVTDCRRKTTIGAAPQSSMRVASFGEHIGPDEGTSVE